MKTVLLILVDKFDLFWRNFGITICLIFFWFSFQNIPSTFFFYKNYLFVYLKDKLNGELGLIKCLTKVFPSKFIFVKDYHIQKITLLVFINYTSLFSPKFQM